MEKNITKGLRQRLISELQNYFEKMDFQGFENVLHAIEHTPRHFFIPIGFEHLAYELNPVLIDSEQTMSSPLTVALQTYFLQLSGEEKILEIGTGSGYQASVLSRLSREIYTLERHEVLYNKAKDTFIGQGIKNVFPYLQDGFDGLEKKAPFDRILITCAAPTIPENLIQQLKTGGILLAPVDNAEGNQDMIRLIKMDDKTNYTESLGIFNFVPMMRGIV